MRFLIETITGRKGYKSFETPEEYINFMAEKGHLVKELKEADLPYTDKPVKLPKISSSKGWSEVSDFGEVGEEAEKGESLIASTSKSVMKDEANMEMSKSSEKADKPEMGLGAEKGDVDMSDFKSFEYEEPKLKSSETKSEPKNDEPKSEEKSESKEDKKETNKSSEKKEDKEEKMNKHDKDIAECLKAAGVKPLNEFFKFDSPEYYNDSWEDPMRSLSDRKYIKWDDRKFQEMCEKMGFDRFMKNCRRFFHQSYGSNTKGNFLSLVGDNKNIDEIIKIVKDNSDKYGYKMFVDFMRKQNGLPSLDSYNHKDNSKLKEGIKDYLPRAGFIRDDDEDKDSRKMGVWGGQGTDDQLRKAKIIAKVKFANGDRMGRVTKEDLDNFEDYKAQYDEIYGSDELDEGWKDKFKKGAATLGVAASLAGNAMAGGDPMYDGARNPNTDDVEIAYSQSENEAPRMVNKKGAMIVDQFGNEWTEREWQKLINGEDPMYDGARNPNTEDMDESFDVEIAECLRIANC